MTPRAPRPGHPRSRTDLDGGKSDVQGRSRVAPESGHPPSRTDLAEAATMTPRAPRAGHRLVTLSASLALHGGLLLAVLLAVSGETEPDALFIDLTEDVRSEAAGAGAGQPAASPTGRGERTLSARSWRRVPRRRRLLHSAPRSRRPSASPHRRRP